METQNPNSNLVYRHFQPGDEVGLANVFNHAFQGLGGGFLRTPKQILWRYMQRPDADPREIQIAEDPITRQIVGSVYATIEHYRFNGQTYKVGAINDVGTLPDYGGRGIGRKLIAQAIKFMEDAQCSYSIMSADPTGHPRAKIYSPAGYQDFIREIVCVGVGNLLQFFRYLPISIPLIPAIALRSLVYTIQWKQLQKKLSRMGYSIEIIHPFRSMGLTKQKSEQIRQAVNRIGVKQLNGFEPFNVAQWHHIRETAPSIGFRPSYVLIWNKNYKDSGPRLIGIGSFLRQWFYSCMLGIHAPVGLNRELLLEQEEGIDVENYNILNEALAAGLIQAAKERDCVALVQTITGGYKTYIRNAKKAGYFSFLGGVCMLKAIKAPALPNLGKKPFFTSPGENFGAP
jgi:GNAT superfamily N-acetyltransferase